MFRPLALVACVCIAAPAAFADVDGVDIIYPPEREEVEAAPAPRAAPRIVLKQKVVVKVVVHLGESRAQARRRALFQNWTGFHKVYSGERYPF